jgi:hypothetical protein
VRSILCSTFHWSAAFALASLLSWAAPACAVERGTWFWYQSSDPNGAANVLGNAAKEDEAITFMRQWDIARVYGSYSSLTTTDPAVVAAWNKKLAAADIASYVMISDGSHGLAANRPGLLSLLDDRLIHFNAGRSDPQERFVGMEMDIEVWTTPQWASASPSGRRDMLLDLRDSFAAMRQDLATAGQGTSKLSAALPVWFDTTTMVAWSNPAEIDQWFTSIGASLNEISLMDYATNNVATILNRVAYERAQFPGTSLVALRTRLDLEWSSLSEFTTAMNSVESATGSGIDIENYYRLRAVVPQPGDFNGNGIVDAADYVLWRKALNTTYSQNDYDAWCTHFGQSTGSGMDTATVLEPASVTIVLSGISLCLMVASRRRWDPRLAWSM